MAEKIKVLTGRPSSYKPEYATQAEKLCKLGATDKDLADFFEVSTRTIERWRVKHDDFCRALKSGKDEADDRVERSLYNRAVGYTYESEKIFNNQGSITRAPCIEHVPPDTTAQIFWLKNRRKDQWRDKTDHEHSGELAVTDTVDRPPNETREEWIARRKRILATDTAMGAAARPANGRDHS